jgi:hypothetical protein
MAALQGPPNTAARVGTRSADFPAAVGKIRHLTSRKLHRFASKVAVGDFALPEPMQQNCASGVVNTS